MLRFFRQIRQRLLTDNKFSKYLLYAVGEILLVVIGILIALQVNSWNENQKAEIVKQIYYKQLIIDLEQQKKHVLEQIAFLDSNVKNYDSYVADFEKADWSITEILQEIGKLNGQETKTLILSSNTLETLKQTGEIKLIPVSLRNELIELERLINYIGQLESRHVSMFIENINKATIQGYSPIIMRYINKPEIMVPFDDDLWKKLILIVEDSFYWKASNEKGRIAILNNILDKFDLIEKKIQLELE